ncbi:hypothetical protein HYT23_01960 [Candidatus Pacearchaeota archaeon]|nr:hypothetical protein [Candidatus Pacearchaeota archaeon]
MNSLGKTRGNPAIVVIDGLVTSGTIFKILACKPPYHHYRRSLAII